MASRSKKKQAANTRPAPVAAPARLEQKHAPKLWVLDEPMTGLDPMTMKSVEVFMRDYAAKGNAILFSSHNLTSVAKLCDRVVIIKQGSQVCDLDMRAEGDQQARLEEAFFNEK